MLYIVVGAGRGLGRQLAERLANREGTLVLAGRTAQHLQELRDLLVEQKHVATVLTRVIDLTRLASIAEFAGWVTDLRQPLRAVVNSAAGFYKGSFKEQDPASIDDVCGANLTGPIHLISELLRRGTLASPCDFVNVTSVSAATNLETSRSSATHIATKAALHLFSQILGREVAAQGVRVTSVAPGTYARQGRPGIPESAVVKMIETVIDLPSQVWVEEIVLRPTGIESVPG